MRIGNKDFDFNARHTYVMGILNVTPDSFSDGGKYNRIDRALFHAEEMIKQGADIIDVGGESTRPGYVKISVKEEIARVTEVISQIKKRFDVPISIDTYKAPVADAALFAGADLGNDIWGLRFPEEKKKPGEKTMAQVLSGYDVPVCLMHNKKDTDYTDFLAEVMSDLQKSVDVALDAGIRKENIILDPGIGFGKTYEQNLVMLKNLSELKKLQFPLLLGASRKSVIGLTLDLPVEQREEGTIVTTVLAVQSDYCMVRVHDVEKNVRAIKMAEKIFCVD